VLFAESVSDCQQLLRVLSEFCSIFGMTVNLAPHKTCVVVFRREKEAVPDGVNSLLYNGQPVPVQEEYTYLGVTLYATKGFAHAHQHMAASGRSALFSMIRRCRTHYLNQFDIRCRMFDILVEPCLSYGCQVWGPSVFYTHVSTPTKPLYMCDAEKVQLHFLRHLAQIGKVCVDVLLRDMHRAPVMHHWVVLAVRWWNTLVQMDPHTSLVLLVRLGCLILS
jgi:hypothetical protein